MAFQLFTTRSSKSLWLLAAIHKLSARKLDGSLQAIPRLHFSSGIILFARFKSIILISFFKSQNGFLEDETAQYDVESRRPASYSDQQQERLFFNALSGLINNPVADNSNNSFAIFTVTRNVLQSTIITETSTCLPSSLVLDTNPCRRRKREDAAVLDLFIQPTVVEK